MTTVRKTIVFAFILCVISVNANTRNAGQNESIVYGEKDLVNYIEKWKVKDGFAGTLISDYFCEFATYNPVLFLRTMKNHLKTYNDWIDQVEDLSFVDWGGCINRECLRRMMISSFQQCRLESTSDLIPLRKKLLNKLNKTKVRRID